MSEITHDLADLVPLKAAIRLVPSCRTGKRLHIATAYRWVLSGKLKAVRIGRHYFVRLEDLQALVQPVAPVPRVATVRQLSRAERDSQEWAREVLKRAGITGPGS